MSPLIDKIIPSIKVCKVGNYGNKVVTQTLGPAVRPQVNVSFTASHSLTDQGILRVQELSTGGETLDTQDDPERETEGEGGRAVRGDPDGGHLLGPQLDQVQHHAQAH